MGFFSDIKDKIFNRHRGEHSVSDLASPAQTHIQEPVSTVTPDAGSTPTTSTPSTAEGGALNPEAGQTLSDTPAVDVATIMDQAVEASGQKLNWRTSIVDLMKALGIDSSLSARKALANELDYAGDTDDSATMNVWLHKQVLAKLAANGGIVPPDLLD